MQISFAGLKDYNLKEKKLISGLYASALQCQVF